MHICHGTIVLPSPIISLLRDLCCCPKDKKTSWLPIETHPDRYDRAGMYLRCIHVEVTPPEGDKNQRENVGMYAFTCSIPVSEV